MENEPNPTTMTNADLRNNLLTLDYRGVSFKTLCLNELIRRAIEDNKETEIAMLKLKYSNINDEPRDDDDETLQNQ
jgi:hypothetical protein